MPPNAIPLVILFSAWKSPNEKSQGQNPQVSISNQTGSPALINRIVSKQRAFTNKEASRIKVKLREMRLLLPLPLDAQTHHHQHEKTDFEKISWAALSRFGLEGLQSASSWQNTLSIHPYWSLWEKSKSSLRSVFAFCERESVTVWAAKTLLRLYSNDKVAAAPET